MNIVERFYDTNAGQEWERLTFEHEPHRWLEFQVGMQIMEKYLPPAPARVLDVGSGPGRYAIALAERGYHVTLFDLSGQSLELAQRNIAEAGVEDRIEGYEQGEAPDLSRVADGCFDAILVMGPLYHLIDEADRLETVRESLRVLKAGGIVLAATINHLGVARAGVSEFPDWYNDPICLNIVDSYINRVPYDEPHGFTEAYFAHPLELRGWYEDAGAKTIGMAAQEGIAGGLRDECRRLAENPTAWQHFVQVVLATCEDPTILGASEHTLYVGRKSRP